MTVGQLIVVLWFCSAIAIAVFGNLVFLIWLKKLGVRPILGLAGTPGYLDYVYVRWCRTQRRSPSLILALRCLSLVNVILAAIVAIPMIISMSGNSN